MKLVHLSVAVMALAILVGCSNDPKAQSERYVSRGNKFMARGKIKEASIMYRRAVKADPKSPNAWYQLGLLNMKAGNLGEARSSFLRVTDLAESSHRFDKDTEDAYAKTVDIDYFALMQALEHRRENQIKEFRADIPVRAKALEDHFPGSFDAYRAAGLRDWAAFASPDPETIDKIAKELSGSQGGGRQIDEAAAAKNKVRKDAILAALDNFRKADKIRPFDASLAYPMISTLAVSGQSEEAEKYAQQIVSRGSTDNRVFDFLYSYYMALKQPERGEAVRKQQVSSNPKAERPVLLLAKHYLATNRRDEMKATLSRLTSDIKTFPLAYATVGDFYKSAYDFDTALALYDQGAKSDPSNKALYLKRTAETYMIVNRQPEAERTIGELVKEYPKDVEVIAMAAAVTLNHAKPGDADKVIAELQPLLAKSSASGAVPSIMLHFNLGRAFAMKGGAQNFDQARVQFEEVNKIREGLGEPPYIPSVRALAELDLQRGENPQALSLAETILRIFPGDATAHMIRCVALINLGELNRARVEGEAVLKLKPDARDARIQLARIDLLQKNYPAADAEFETLRKAGDPRGLNGLIEIRVLQNKTPDAIQMVQTELAKQPGNSNLRGILAALEFKTGKFPEAAEEYRKLIGQSPNAAPQIRAGWLVQLGEALRQKGDVNGALEAYNQAKKTDPKNVAARIEIAMMEDGMGKSAEARSEYQDVLRIDPDDAIALNNLAYLEADNGTNLDQALTYAQRAKKKRPQDPNIDDTLGLIYYRKGILDESSRLFTELVNKAPGSATFHLHLAMTLYKRGDIPQARRELDAARRNRPTNREQVQIKDLQSKLG